MSAPRSRSVAHRRPFPRANGPNPSAAAKQRVARRQRPARPVVAIAPERRRRLVWVRAVDEARARRLPVAHLVAACERAYVATHAAGPDLRAGDELVALSGELRERADEAATGLHLALRAALETGDVAAFLRCAAGYRRMPPVFKRWTWAYHLAYADPELAGLRSADFEPVELLEAAIRLRVAEREARHAE